MMRWTSFFSLLRSVRKHVASIGSTIQPYDDFSKHTVGFRCVTTGEVWQIDITTMDESLPKDPNIVKEMRSSKGREFLAKLLTKGFSNFSIPKNYESIVQIIELESQ